MLFMLLLLPYYYYYAVLPALAKEFKMEMLKIEKNPRKPRHVMYVCTRGTYVPDIRNT